MARFEVGKTYGANDSGIDSITIIRRTDKSIWFRNAAGSMVRQKVRVDENGDEYTTDSYVPEKWRDAFTHSAKFEERPLNDKEERD